MSGESERQLDDMILAAAVDEAKRLADEAEFWKRISERGTGDATVQWLEDDDA